MKTKNLSQNLSALEKSYRVPKPMQLALVLLLAGVLRLAWFDGQSLSMDEVKDLQVARSGFAQVLAAEDRFPPFYHTTLGVWLRCFQWDPTGRLFSVFCGLLTVCAAAGLGRCLGGHSAGLAAAMVVAISPFAVWYSVESRVYGLYLLLGTAALWQFFRATEKTAKESHRGAWPWYVAVSVLGIYTHYYFGLLTALAAGLFFVQRPERSQFRAGLAAFAAIGVLSLPAVWCLMEDLDQPWGHAQTSQFTLAGLGYTYFSFFSGYSLGPSLRELHVLSAHEALAAIALWVGVLGLPVAVLIAQGCAAVENRSRNRVLLWLLTFGIAPSLIVGLVSQFASFGYNIRHTLWSCMPLLILMAVGMAKGRPRWLACVASLLVVVSFAVAVANQRFSERYRVEDSRAVAVYLQTESTPTVPVFVLSRYMAAPLRHYLPASWSVHPLPDAADKSEKFTNPTSILVRTNLGNSKIFWLAYSRAFHGDPQGKTLAALREEFGLKLKFETAGYQVFRGSID